jgi:hypothetical protein
MITKSSLLLAHDEMIVSRIAADYFLYSSKNI